ncbi:MAG: MTH1187 family thiamine-binding protein [Candidatus Thermoplasmatota archaeon]|nr:MTH1187 family thiamine-binding protein [Candidatus Thermoplasmatota archaeon]
MIIAQLSISPVGKNIGLSKYVKKVLEVLKKEPISIETNAMATVIEATDIETLLSAVNKAHNCLFEVGVQRVITELKIDDRRDKNATITSKLISIK